MQNSVIKNCQAIAIYGVREGDGDTKPPNKGGKKTLNCRKDKKSNNYKKHGKLVPLSVGAKIPSL